MQQPHQVSDFDESAIQAVIDYFRKLPDDHINQANDEYTLPAVLCAAADDFYDWARDDVPPPTDHCLALHFAYALGAIARRDNLDGTLFISAEDGFECMAYCFSPLLPSGEDHYKREFAALMTESRAPAEPFSASPWETRPEIVLERAIKRAKARKEQPHDECQDDADWEWQAGVRA